MKFDLTLETIDYIKIACKDVEGNTITMKAAVKRMSSREIFACSKYEETLVVKTPQEVDLSIVSANGLYLAKTNLRFIDKEAPYVFFTFDLPQNIEYRQSREFFRVKIQEKIVLSVKDSLGKREQVSANIHDISANGVRIILDSDLPSTDDVLLTLYLGDKVVKTKAVFSRFDNEDNIKKVSFKFTEISENDRDFISQFCIKHQLMQKRRSFN